MQLENLRELKHRRRDYARAELTLARVSFTSHSNDILWKLPHYGVDYWPTANKWTKNGESHRGDIFDLLEFLFLIEPVKEVKTKARLAAPNLIIGRTTPCRDTSLPPLQPGELPWA